MTNRNRSALILTLVGCGCACCPTIWCCAIVEPSRADAGVSGVASVPTRAYFAWVEVERAAHVVCYADRQVELTTAILRMKR